MSSGKLGSCLKHRNARVHPHCVQTSSRSDPQINSSCESDTNWSLYRTSFVNLSKRFKSRNNRIGANEITAVSHTASEIENSINNNVEPEAVRRCSSTTNSRRGRLKDASIFASNRELDRNPDSFKSVNFIQFCVNPETRRHQTKSTSNSCGFKRFLAITVLVHLCVVIFVIPSVLGEFGGKEEFLKNIWNDLTNEEIADIFGRQYSKSQDDFVPNFDIIQPKLVHRKARGKRSLEPGPTKHIRLQGLGRVFSLDLKLNRNLLDPHFVFLKRGRNSSEILPNEDVEGKLGCFYQGRAKHWEMDVENSENSENDAGRDSSTAVGPVALSLCNGLKGFILPPSPTYQQSAQDNHHYVIHPIPSRFKTQKRGERERDQSLGTEDHHFLFRFTSPSLQSSVDDSSRRRRRSADDPFDSYWLHHQQRYDQRLANFYNSQPYPPYAPAAALSVFPSSYWGQGQRESRVHLSSPGITGASNVGLSFSRRSFEVGGAASRNFERTAPAPSFTKSGEGVEVEEEEEEEEEEDVILPFYTKGGKKNKKNGKYSKRKKPGWVSSGEQSSWNSSLRKGRGDEGFFGDEWASPLDKDDNDFNRLLMDKRGGGGGGGGVWNTGGIESNSIYASKESGSRGGGSTSTSSELTIETAVFVDKDLFKHMESNFPEDTHAQVVQIVLAMINAVQLLYQDPSLGHRVDFVLKRLEILESDPPGLIRPFDIDRFLTNFCKWQKTENPPSDEDTLHWDHALILTGLDLYVVHQSGKISNQVVGLAPVAGMCTRSSSCTVNEGRHFESVFVISHEIGHNLGMRHDGPQAENDCDPTSSIMSPTLGSGKITWSSCSKKYLEMFLESSQSKCLLDKGKSELRLDHEADNRLPGERFDADKQCVLKYGRGSFHAVQQPLEDVCRDLHCRREHYTWTSHPALEGTYCGAEMWCRAGKCSRKSSPHFPFSSTSSSSSSSSGGSGGSSSGGIDPISNHLPSGETAAYSLQKAVDGVWGQWSLFTDCSSACLFSDGSSLTLGSTGVRLAARRCDSPRPEHGGRQCTGPDRRYKTCPKSKNPKICGHLGERTTIAQYANDVCSRAAGVDAELTGTGFMMSTNDVWCDTQENVPRSRGWSFPDGTACSLISQSQAEAYCIAGKCQDFTCNPYSYYALSDEECTATASNEVSPQSSWYRSRGSELVGGYGAAAGGMVGGSSGWGEWEAQSDCKLPCLAPAKGLELVRRGCRTDFSSSSPCEGLGLSVRLCKPDKSAILRNGCSRLQTPFEYATKVCSKYAEKIPGLSGIGMQLSPTKDDKDRPCRIGCQDLSIAYRYYMVNGEDGWFPAGTDCGRGDPDKKAFCVVGKCVDFGSDDTPVYRVNTKLMGRIENLFQRRSKRGADANSYNILEELRVPFSMDEIGVKELVRRFSKHTGNFPALTTGFRRFGFDEQAQASTPIDFNSPITTTHDYLNYHRASDREALGAATFHSRSSETATRGRGHGRSFDFGPSQLNRNGYSGSGSERIMEAPLEGSYYEWRKIVSDCSVSCGKGIQEVIVECVSGDVVVSDHFCGGRPRPGYSGYVDCIRNAACTSYLRFGGASGGGHIWNWLQSILPKNSTKPK